MLTPTNMDNEIWLRQQPEQASEDQLREMVRTTAHALLSADVDRVCGADYGVDSEPGTAGGGTIDRDATALCRPAVGVEGTGWMCSRRRWPT